MDFIIDSFTGEGVGGTSVMLWKRSGLTLEQSQQKKSPDGKGLRTNLASGIGLWCRSQKKTTLLKNIYCQ
jgi:hypothetical protein